MIIHLLPRGAMVTNCGLSVAGRDAIAVSTRGDDVTCDDCKVVSDAA